MKFRYQITVQVGVRDVNSNAMLIPHETFVVLYDSPEELNFLNPLHQTLTKRVARICYENNLLEEDRLKDLSAYEMQTELTMVDQKYLKQIRNKEDEL